eukprot:TRINITY_DN29946_c1_g1_i2.p1 TRINITY_DN29946_c1_g1~~TRINITY_DN29946_c1_g1_i2.p1  ORF type:complete len:236 (+),score=42.13 TRINITY_DN29946_c1_g1_i2:39-746(+)
MYPGHIPTNCFQKALLSVGSAVGATLDPWRRGDLVGVLGETTGEGALRAMRDRMKETASGRRVLFERPRIKDNELLERLKPCKEGTFGQRYRSWMVDHGFQPDERPAVQFVDDEELAYVMMRYRETHDFAHALTGLPMSVVGEMALKAFEYRQTGIPMTGFASLAGAVHLTSPEIRYFVEKAVPWAHQAAQGELVASVMWEDMFDADIDELRAELLIPVAPLPPPPQPCWSSGSS